MSAGADDPLATFEAWASERTRDAQRPLSPRSIEKYRAIWQSWLRHLADKRIPWRKATPRTLEGFVAAVQPRSRRQPQASTVTRTRYWRTVTALYEFAALHALAQNLPEGDPRLLNPMRRAKPPADARSEHARSSVLTLVHWRALYETWPVGRDWTVQRDRALLLLELDTAMTVQELRALTVQAVHFGRGANVAQVHVDGSRAAQARTLELGAQASQALLEWLDTRELLNAKTAAVFISRKGHRTPSAMAIWHNLSGLVQQALGACGDAQWHHAGPTVLRNAVLLRWLLDGMPPGEVARRAGLGSVRKLERLAEHCDLATQARLRAAIAPGLADDDVRGPAR